MYRYVLFFSSGNSVFLMTLMTRFSTGNFEYFQGKEIIQYYIDELISEGVKDLPRFEDSTGKPRTKTLNEPLICDEAVENSEISDSEEEDKEAIMEGATAARKYYGRCCGSVDKILYQFISSSWSIHLTEN